MAVNLSQGRRDTLTLKAAQQR
ncbi:MAG: hypothetical protein HW404_2098, partial [Anaerolineales bacterium]|nr:hypothetical protein [Anaerolineales bacterium]